jgi:hypothetical protein
MTRRNHRLGDLSPVSGRRRKQGLRTPAGDPEHERNQPINRDDRKAMLRSYFRTKGLSEAEIDAHLSKAKV